MISLHKLKFAAVVLLVLSAGFDASLAQGAAEGDNQADQTAAGKKAGVRLKDLARITGIRTNQLLGYGLVVGLPGTGDSRSHLASESIGNLLGGLGQNLDKAGLNARNIAAVIVTAEVPPFAGRGDRVNATVSSIGDARSLEGGVLIQTPLYAGNKTIYAVAQGVVTTGGKNQERGFSRTGDTVGLVLNGAAIERDVPARILEPEEQPDPATTPRPEPPRRVRVSLNHFDFSTLNAVSKRLAETFTDAKVAIEGGSIVVTIPEGQGAVDYIARMEQIRIVPDYRARVVINERTGTIVMGGEVRVDPVAISRGGMELIVTGDALDARQGIHVQSTLKQLEERKPVTKEFKGSDVGEIVQGLNDMGANVQDVIAILEALRDSGALHAELIVN
ncbi:MAG: flagellar basal body P-ring protein FlgI [bacterium]|nr:flagellar basal body P-ring protein FlgI [bacterium]